MKKELTFVGLIFLYTGAVILCYPPFNLWFLSWVAFVPLLFILKNRTTKLFLLLIPQFLINLFVLYWLKPVSSSLYYTLCIIFSFIGLLPILIAKFCKEKNNSILIPGLFTVFEYLRTLGPYGFPFLVIGYTQYKIPYLIQPAALGGVWLISFLIYTVNYLIYKYITSKDRKYLKITFLIFTAMIIYGLPFKEEKIDSLKIALIQPNTNMFLNNWDKKQDDYFLLYKTLSQQTLAEKPQLIIWPETAVGISLRKDRNTAKKLRKIINELQSDILLGNIDEHLLSLKFKEKYNSAFYINKYGQVIDEHQKTRLIPFIEIINYQLFLPLNLREKIKSGVYLKGNKIRPLKITNYKAATIICFEAVFGDHVQKITKQRTNIIYNLSSDGWSNSLAEHQLNFMVNIFRAVENRLYVVRISDNGISGIISPRGSIISIIPAFQQGTLTKTVPLLNNYSFYAKHGDLFIKLLTLFCLIYPIRTICRSKNHS
jgi:apolipoprotein N-acyltransferase